MREAVDSNVEDTSLSFHSLINNFIPDWLTCGEASTMRMSETGITKTANEEMHNMGDEIFLESVLPTT